MVLVVPPSMLKRAAIITFKKPVHEIRVGSIKAAIWENQTANGLRHNVTLSRLYKEDDQWKDSTSFGRDDLLVLAKVADLAHSWICDQSQRPDGAG